MKPPLSTYGTYEDHHLDRVAFPLGGIGAGMICLGGTGAFQSASLRHYPQILNEPILFSAISVKQEGSPNVARVLEGPVPEWKIVGDEWSSSGSGGKTFGLPRFESAKFTTRFPFADITLSDTQVPLSVRITGWSPFIPGDADNSSLPVAAIEYEFSNPGQKTIEAVYSFHAENFLAIGSEKGEWDAANRVSRGKHGFTLEQEAYSGRPWTRGYFNAWVDDEGTKVNPSWFRGGWFDSKTMVWKSIQDGTAIDAQPLTQGAPSRGGSLYVPIRLEPGAKKTVTLKWAWYVPVSNQECYSIDGKRHCPWYASKFSSVNGVAGYWRENYSELKKKTQVFSDAFYDSTLPPEVIDAAAANLTILKSPTVMREFNGQLWAWEGCHDSQGSCHGTCSHVWNYAQALPHLFPELERSLRQVEFFDDRDEHGHQNFRSTLPSGPHLSHTAFAAADGQPGGVIKVYREWRISGDLEWLKKLWPEVKRSLNYCIETWDPEHLGVFEEPHHNTYDIEFWGPEGMCTSFYLGALKAAAEMGQAVGDEVPLYSQLLKSGRAFLEDKLFNGEYFYQQIKTKGLRTGDLQPMVHFVASPEADALIEQEGPKYQVGTGCLSDGIIGAWMGWAAGLGPFIDEEKVGKHLDAVFQYNFKEDLSTHANPQRSSYALGREAGLLLCTWPKGGRLTLPMVYSEEVWTGIEYQVAAHLISLGRVKEGLTLVRAVRSRYDGTVRNPFNEFECGHWYARAMASYSLLQALTGARYDAVDQTLYLEPRIKGDFRSFLSTATGLGTVGVKDGQPFLEVKAGQIEMKKIEYKAA